MANSRLRFFLAIAAGAASLALSGCVNYSPLDDLAVAQPPATPFEKSLFKDYAFLAHSFGDVGAASYTTFDQEGSMSLADSDSNVAGLANAFAAKALALSHGDAVDPVPGVDVKSHELRDRLVRALTPGRDTYSRDAARAQADYDCWMLNMAVASQARAAAQCKHSLDITLTRLENDVRASAAAPAPAAGGAPAQPPAPAPVQAPPPQSSVAPPASAQAAAYTVYFDFDSRVLTANDMHAIQEAVNTARAGGQSRILVVGYTDTSGPEDYNMRLSAKRADAVRDVLVELGARRESIETKGVGKTDPAVPTQDGVREPKNRRAVVTLSI